MGVRVWGWDKGVVVWDKQLGGRAGYNTIGASQQHCSHLNSMCQAAICLILNTNGCHGSTSIGDGIRDEKTRFWSFGQCSSNIESLDSLKSIS